MNEVIRRAAGALCFVLLVGLAGIGLIQSDDDAAYLIGGLCLVAAIIAAITLVVAIGRALMRGPDKAHGSGVKTRRVGRYLMLGGTALVIVSGAIALNIDAEAGSPTSLASTIGAIAALYVGFPVWLWGVVHATNPTSH